MKARSTLCPYLLLAASAALWLSTASAGFALQPQQPAAPSTATATVAAGEAAAPDLPLVSLLLRRRHELRLSGEQVSELETLRADFQKQAIRRAAEIRLHEIELRELLDKKPFDQQAVETKVRGIDALRTELRLVGLKTGAEATSKLSPAQQNQIEALGAALSPTQGETLAPDLRNQVQAIMREQYQQQDVVELRVAETVATKLLDWFKTLGLVIGVPLAVLLALLTFLGFRTVKDLRDKVDKFRADVDAELQQASASIDNTQRAAQQSLDERLATAEQGLDQKIAQAGQWADELKAEFEAMRANSQAMRAEGEAIKLEYQKHREQLAVFDKLGEEVRELTSRVNKLETFVIHGSADLTPEVEQRLKSALSEFQDYFKRLGLAPGGAPVGVRLDPRCTFDSAYNPDDNVIVLNPVLAGDNDDIFQGYAHYALIKTMEDENKLQTSFGWLAIEYGLSMYLASSYKDNPTFGEIYPQLHKLFPDESESYPHIRVFDLTNDRNLSDVRLGEFSAVEVLFRTDRKDLMQKLADAGEAWGGTYWDIRSALGKESTDALLCRAWTEVSFPDDEEQTFVAFAEQVLKTARSSELADRVEQIREIFQRRGLNISAPQPPDAQPPQPGDGR